MYQTNLFLDSINAVKIRHFRRQFLILNIKMRPTLILFIDNIPFAPPAWWNRRCHFKLHFKNI